MTWLDLGSIKIIELCRSSVLGLREPNPTSSKSDESGCTENEANLATEVTGIWVEHIWEHETNQPLNDAEDDVGKALGSRAKTPGWDLCHDGPCNCTQGDLVNEALSK